uniref:Uncharacterized protein n=1 Tax=Gossypium raimondii TaxID=29730 RepID=A0A0D2QEU1_GOSRA|nr:hypothetical protein B456_009G126500 [Gossypium raimondii]
MLLVRESIRINPFVLTVSEPKGSSARLIMPVRNPVELVLWLHYDKQSSSELQIEKPPPPISRHQEL